ncbi:MAG: type 1 glutamine amidotransferase [Deltaproteobacteria bacterium]|nr:type 1 glutamine amidotransferase [Deltaproteobacteria bacterium]MBM4324178.1 type 1 glutamine amidotransferase [Deltaproteobacteria bacterium]
MRLKGKKVVILVENHYQDLEFWVPYYRLKEEGAEVTVVGSGSARTYTSKYGYPVEVQKEAKEIDPSKYDGVVIPGGYAPDLMRRYPEMVRIVREAYEKGKMVSAICHAGWMLASAGILKGKKATGVVAIKDDMVNAGANFVDAEVVRDGNLITSRKPDDLPAFCREIIEVLSK